MCDPKLSNDSDTKPSALPGLFRPKEKTPSNNPRLHITKILAQSFLEDLGSVVPVVKNS